MSDLPEISRILLDTNAFLYFINNDPALSGESKNLIESDVELLLSSASLWEIAIKCSIGKLYLPDAFGNFISQQIQRNDIEILPVTIPYLDKLSTLEFHHKDPFDRLIIAQSLVENIPVMSSDSAFDQYGIERIWK